MALSFNDARKRYEGKFPKNTLLDFRGIDEPCIIKCAVHGETKVSRYENLVRSVHGCPKCAAEATSKRVKVERQSTTDLRHRINVLEQTLRDNGIEVPIA